jgi:hypothetical protein
MQRNFLHEICTYKKALTHNINEKVQKRWTWLCEEKCRDSMHMKCLQESALNVHNSKLAGVGEKVSRRCLPSQRYKLIINLMKKFKLIFACAMSLNFFTRLVLKSWYHKIDAPISSLILKYNTILCKHLPQLTIENNYKDTHSSFKDQCIKLTWKI